MTFHFNQDPKTKDCGYRCLYYILNPKYSYEELLDKLKWLEPVKKGISFSNIVTILEHHGRECKFTIPSNKGLYLMWSGVWSKGHYFIYHDGIILDSLAEKPYPMSLEELISKVESKSTRDTFYCLKIVV